MFWHGVFEAFKQPRFLQSLISEINHLWNSSLFSKYFKIYVDSRNNAKNWEKKFKSDLIEFELVALDTRFYWERILVIRCQHVKERCQDFRYYQNKVFRADSLLEWTKNMTKILPWRFKQSFGWFGMLTVHKCSDIDGFRHSSNLAFCSLYFLKEITSEGHLFFKVVQMLCRFQICSRKLRK